MSQQQQQQHQQPIANSILNNFLGDAILNKLSHHKSDDDDDDGVVDGGNGGHNLNIKERGMIENSDSRGKSQKKFSNTGNIKNIKIDQLEEKKSFVTKENAAKSKIVSNTDPTTCSSTTTTIKDATSVPKTIAATTTIAKTPSKRKKSKSKLKPTASSSSPQHTTTTTTPVQRRIVPPPKTSANNININIDHILSYFLQDDTYSNIVPWTRIKVMHAFFNLVEKTLYSLLSLSPGQSLNHFDDTIADDIEKGDNNNNNNNNSNNNYESIFSRYYTLLECYQSGDETLYKSDILNSLMCTVLELRATTTTTNTSKFNMDDNVTTTATARSTSSPSSPPQSTRLSVNEQYVLCNTIALKYASKLEHSIYRQSNRDAELYRSKVLQLMGALKHNGVYLLSQHYLPHQLIVLDDESLVEGTEVAREKQEYLDTVRMGEIMVDHILHNSAVDTMVKNNKQDIDGSRCRKCKAINSIVVDTQQTRGADEGMTVFYECTNCGLRWTMQ
jgi:DNA-directed RNA polymerase subunit M/transcription elongation factor TFIIS